jgi:formylglycine-generating enzyme required for sulfatase activity
MNMKKMSTPLYGLIVLTLLLSACNLPFGNAVEPTLEIPVATLELPSSPTLEPLVPEAPTIGSTISWFDTSTLVYVPAGEFVMGADEPEEQDFNPSHRVNVNGIWIYSTKVTNEMYNLCVSLGQCTPAATTMEEPSATLSGTSLVSYFTSPEDNGYALKDLPVTSVTWDQADNYCKWVGGRLPTEAEWEKTARGTKIQPYPWGEETPACDLLNFGECNGLLSNVLDHPEGISDYMALDMAGNAYEWVSDWYEKDYYAQSPSSNPAGPVDGEERSVRGSSFDTGVDSVFSAQRSSLEPDQYKMDVSFRCVVDDPAVFAPICEAPAAIPASADAPEPGQSASESDASSSEIETFDVSSLPVKYSYYCANKPANLGGANISFDGTKLYTLCKQPKGFYGASPLPNNFSFQWIGVGKPKTLVLWGPSGSSFSYSMDLSDCNSAQTPPKPPQGAPAVCAAGYTLQSNGSCFYTSTSGQPTSMSCPGGYSYNSETQCCTKTPPQAGNQPNQYPACGPGNIYDPQQKICYKPGSSTSTFVPSTITYPFKLGSCDDPKPKDSDKPSQPQQPEPTPCVIDPFTGACH